MGVECLSVDTSEERLTYKTVIFGAGTVFFVDMRMKLHRSSLVY